jgi:S1-C subfamily serine protease
MSGLDVVYDGKQLVKEEVIKSYTHSNESSGASSINFITSFSFKFKPSFRINSVLKNSPAEKAGLLKGDLILKINGKPSHEFNLNDIIYKFQERHNKRIKMYVKRNEEILKFQFRLEKKV